MNLAQGQVEQEIYPEHLLTMLILNNSCRFAQERIALLFPFSLYCQSVHSLDSLQKSRGCRSFSDELNHASLIQGIKNANVECHVFRHNDTEHLEELLKTANANTPKIIVFESLYSMEGITFSSSKNY